MFKQRTSTSFFTKKTNHLFFLETSPQKCHFVLLFVKILLQNGTKIKKRNVAIVLRHFVNIAL